MNGICHYNVLTMTSTISKCFSIRTFSTKCSPTPIGGIWDYCIQNTSLPNKVDVTSAENETPTSIISIIYRAGTRNEPPDAPGLIHTLRTCALISTKNASEFAIVRNVQQNGACLSCLIHRQIVAYLLQGTRGAIEKTLPFLTEVATNQIYEPWEISDNVSCMKEELKFLPPMARIKDLIHKAAFRRGGLGNSLYIPEYNLDKVSSESLQNFVKTNFTTGRTVVAALGVDHGMLLKYVATLNLPSGEAAHPPSPYKGGEVRIETGGTLAYVALALEGFSYSFKNLTLSRIIKRVLFGNQPPKSRCFKYSNLFNSPYTSLGKVVQDITEPVEIAPFHYTYSDTGLIGVTIASHKDVIGKLVEVATASLKTKSIEEGEFNVAKAQTKGQFLMNCESPMLALYAIGRQAVYGEVAHSLKDLEEIADGVSLTDVNEALSKVAEGKLSMAALGSLENVPYLDEMQ